METSSRTRVTRRSLGRMLAAAAAAPVALEVQAPAQAPPAPNVSVARSELAIYSKQLAAVELPMSTEPAFRFKP